jgi:hypothetical protein
VYFVPTVTRKLCGGVFVRFSCAASLSEVACVYSAVELVIS